MATLDKEALRRKRSVQWRQAQQVAWHCRKRLRLAFDGSIASAQNWSSIVFGALVAALVDWFGVEIVVAKGKLGDAAIFVLSVAAAWILIFLWRLVWSAPRIARSEGTWVRNEFVFNTPQLVLTTDWQLADNGTRRRFPITVVPPHSSIRFRIELEGLANPSHVRASLGFEGSPPRPPDFMQPGGSIGMILMDGSGLMFDGHILPNTNKPIFKVYVLGYFREDPPPYIPFRSG